VNLNFYRKNDTIYIEYGDGYTPTKCQSINAAKRMSRQMKKDGYTYKAP
jgi:hypothetical protein